jgi:hypothetical protein
MRALLPLLSICLAAAWLAATPVAADGTLTVTGRGEAFAAPDEARVTVGVTTEAAEASVAMRQNSEAMAAVMARLAALGIAEEDLQTTALSLQPRWDHRATEDGAPRITGFIAANLLTVRVRDLEALGGVLGLGQRLIQIGDDVVATSSIPIDTRTTFGAAPALTCWASDSWRWVVEAEWMIRTACRPGSPHG